MGDVNYSLISAVREGNYTRVKQLIDGYGLSYSRAWSGGYNLLLDALKFRHTNVAKLLLTHDCQVNSTSQNPSDTPLHLAVDAGDVRIVEMMLDRGANIGVENKYGQTPLYKAIIRKNIEVTELFLKRRADVNARNKDGESALHVAANVGCLQIAKLLLKSGANVHFSCTGEWKKLNSPLHVAVEKGSKELVMLLLSEGAHVDVKAENNMTPLHIAAKKGHVPIAEDLLNHGACINSLTLEEEYMPLHFACEQGNEEAVELLLNRGADSNAGAKGNSTPLQIATKKEHQKVVRLLLEHGAKVDHQDQDGKTVLYHAATEGNLGIVEDVLKYCPDINNESNRSSLTAAVLCFRKNHQRIVKALLEYGFIICPEDANVPGFLHTAVGRRYLKIVEDLLKYGANVNARVDSTANGYTPLHLAVKTKQEEIAKLLISHEADVNAQGKIGRTAIFYAVDNVDVKITQLLLNSGANVKDNPELLNNAAEKGCIEIVEALLQHGADINTSDEYGRTALHFTASGDGVYPIKEAVMSIKGEIAKLLLSKGANINSQTENGETPLHVAAGNGCAKVVQVLLEYNANTYSEDTSDDTQLHRSGPTEREEISKMLLNKAANINAKRNDDGMTALHIATQYCSAKSDCDEMTPKHRRIQLNYMAIIRTILKFGADVDSRNKDGKTALHIACQKGQVAVVKTLLEFGSDINIMDNSNNTPFDDAVHAQMSCNILSINRGYAPHNICSYNETVDALNLHIVKMKTANLYVSEQNLILFRKHDIGETKTYFKECEVEILSMKNEKIDNSTISYYAILAKDISSLALCMGNETVVQVFKSGHYKAKFPIYASMIQSHFRKAWERHELLKQASGTFHFLFNNFPKLPNHCTENILNYLSNKDLRLFYGCMLSAS